MCGVCFASSWRERKKKSNAHLVFKILCGGVRQLEDRHGLGVRGQEHLQCRRVVQLELQRAVVYRCRRSSHSGDVVDCRCSCELVYGEAQNQNRKSARTISLVGAAAGQCNLHPVFKRGNMRPVSGGVLCLRAKCVRFCSDRPCCSRVCHRRQRRPRTHASQAGKRAPRSAVTFRGTRKGFQKFSEILPEYHSQPVYRWLPSANEKYDTARDAVKT